MGAAMTYLDEPEKSKDVSDGGSMENDGARYGVCGMQGWRRNMEDAHLTIANFDHDVGLYGVFDGHGGKAVSKFAAKELPGLLKATEAYKQRDFKKALEEAFLEVDVKLRSPEGRDAVKELDRPDPGNMPRPIVLPKRMVQRFMGQHSIATDDSLDAPGASEQTHGDAGSRDEASQAAETGSVVDANSDKHEASNEDAPKREGEDDEEESDDLVAISPAAFAGDASPEAQGCTAVVVLVVRSQEGDGPRLYCANAGDSRAVMSRQGAVVALSEDHKPEGREETTRITKAGGYVNMEAPGGPRVMGDLNLSRAFGDLRYKTSKDLHAKAQVLSCFPEVRVIPVTSDDEFIVIGCDGIWEMQSNQSAIDFVRPRLRELLASDADTCKPMSSICADICDHGLCHSMDQNENPAFDGHGCDNMTVTVVQLKSTITGEVNEAVAKAAAEAERFAAVACGRVAADAEPEREAPVLTEAVSAKRQKCEESTEPIEADGPGQPEGI